MISKIRPHVPPITLFQPLSSDYLNNLTETETLLAVLKKLNETIQQVNSNTQFINNYAGEIEELQNELAALRVEIETFEGEITADINRRFEEFMRAVNGQLAVLIAQANSYTDTKIAEIQAEIDEIIIGNIRLYDPTTGLLSPIQIILDNIYNASRDNALTATEYDTLELSATEYDAEEITAYDYDQRGKIILMPEGD